MLIAMRNAMMAGGGGWKNPYVTDGLIAMWDGEWNAGGGVHDPNATTWVDLSGNGHDLAMVTGTLTDGVWAANNLICSGKAATLPYFIDDIQALEFVGRRTSERTYQVAAGFQHFANNDYYTRMVCYSNGQISFSHNTPSMAANINDLFTASTNFSDNALFRNGERITTTGAGDYYGAGGSTGVQIGWSGIGYRFGGEIYSMRLYSRALTAAEVAANYVVDKARFNLPDAT